MTSKIADKYAINCAKCGLLNEVNFNQESFDCVSCHTMILLEVDVRQAIVGFRMEEYKQSEPPKIDVFNDIKNMHDHYGLRPDMMTPAFFNFRLDFLQEELDETKSAFNDALQFANLRVTDSHIRELTRQKAAAIVDGLIDLIVVASGTLDLIGVDTHEAWMKVHAANMSKMKKENPNRPGSNGFDLVKPDEWESPDHTENVGKLATEIFPAARTENALKSVQAGTVMAINSENELVPYSSASDGEPKFVMAEIATERKYSVNETSTRGQLVDKSNAFGDFPFSKGGFLGLGRESGRIYPGEHFLDGGCGWKSSDAGLFDKEPEWNLQNKNTSVFNEDSLPTAKIFDELKELHLRKSSDYQNPKSPVKQADHFIRGVQTPLDEIRKKVLRIESILQKIRDDEEPNFDSLEDSFRDVAVYSTMAIGWLRKIVLGQDKTKNIFNE